MPTKSCLIVVAALLVSPPSLRAQFPSVPGQQAAQERVHRYQVGVTITAQGGPCAGLFATIGVPTEWPEQQVKIVDEEFSSHVRGVKYRNLEDGARQMLVSIPRLSAGQTATALITYEVTKTVIEAPLDTAAYVIPKRVSREMRKYLAASPAIETRNSKIRGCARDVARPDLPAWQQVETIYDYVRENIEHRNGKLKGATMALRDQHGNHEDLTSLFIALCRINKIPARTVWIPQYCHAEFYLETAEGEGRWFPCQVAGVREFGSSPDLRPILQKGDSIRVPEKKEPQRFVGEFLKGKGGRGLGKPSVRFVRKVLPSE